MGLKYSVKEQNKFGVQVVGKRDRVQQQWVKQQQCEVEIACKYCMELDLMLSTGVKVSSKTFTIFIIFYFYICKSMIKSMNTKPWQIVSLTCL